MKTRSVSKKMLPCRFFAMMFLFAFIILLDWAGAEPDSPIRLEAESFELKGYVVVNNLAASGRKAIQSTADENVYTEAGFWFNGKTGYYDMAIYYFDESDGVSPFKVKTGSKWADNWKASRYLNNDGTGADNLVTRMLKRVKLSHGDRITLYGAKNQGEYARVDCIDLFYLGDGVTGQAGESAGYDRLIPFKLDQQGFVRNWYTLGPVITPVDQNAANEKQLRIGLMEKLRQPALPDNHSFQRLTPSGEAWEPYAGGMNVFVETYRFFFNLSTSEYYGLTCLTSDTAEKVKARLWSSRGMVQLWCNGHLVARREQTSGSHMNFVEFSLPLSAGTNLLFVREWDLGARNTPQLFGVQIMNGQERIGVGLPGSESTAAFFKAQDWLYGIKYNPAGALESALPPPQKAIVKLEREKHEWPAGQTLFPLDAAKQPFRIKLAVNLQDNVVERELEIPRFYPYPPALPALPLLQYRREYLRLLSEKERNSIYGLIVKSVLGETLTDRDRILRSQLARIDSRADCSDFYLAGILRLYRMGALTPEEQALVRKTALNFRYWSDENGTDAMAMTSENHAVLFHTNQRMAGLLFPEERFKRSGRIGKEQAGIARERLILWLGQVEQEGFTEYLSNSYVPVTLGGLLNLVDYADDPEISLRARQLIDRIMVQLAKHSFDGITSGPQGRIYRNGALYPGNAGTQAILSYATPKAPLSFNPWIAFLASSRYVIPDVEDWLDRKVDMSYRQGGTQITLCKTASYMASSVALPPPSGGKGYLPGRLGSQEHLWEIRLKGDTHIFVNHPGASFEASESRPAYWNGNGILPTLLQKGSVIVEIFEIPQDYPLHMTHAHWPSDRFDLEKKVSSWMFAKKGTGYIGLWCSQPTVPAGDILLGCEVRAYGSKIAWIAIASSEAESGSFEMFITRCQAMRPAFDAAAGTVRFDGAIQLRWGGK